MSNYLIGLMNDNRIELIHSIKADTKENAKKRYKTAFRCALRTNSTDDDIIIIGEYKDGFLELENGITINKSSDCSMNAKNKKDTQKFDKIYSAFKLQDSPNFKKNEQTKTENNKVYFVYIGTKYESPMLIEAPSGFDAVEKYKKTYPFAQSYKIMAEQMFLYYIEYNDTRGTVLMYDTSNFHFLSKQHESFYSFRKIVQFRYWDDELKREVKRKYPNWKGEEYEFWNRNTVDIYR